MVAAIPCGHPNNLERLMSLAVIQLLWQILSRPLAVIVRNVESTRCLQLPNRSSY